LFFLGRIRTSQWVTANPNKIFSRPPQDPLWLQREVHRHSSLRLKCMPSPFLTTGIILPAPSALRNQMYGYYSVSCWSAVLPEPLPSWPGQARQARPGPIPQWGIGSNALIHAHYWPIQPHYSPFSGARVPFSLFPIRAQNRNSSQSHRAHHSLNAASVEHWRACAYPKQQRRVQPLNRSDSRSTAIGRSGLTPARIHPPRSRPKAIPGLSISAESTAAAAKVATIAAQNCH
jgi:hypothetical protein